MSSIKSFYLSKNEKVVPRLQYETSDTTLLDLQSLWGREFFLSLFKMNDENFKLSCLGCCVRTRSLRRHDTPGISIRLASGSTRSKIISQRYKPLWAITACCISTAERQFEMVNQREAISAFNIVHATSIFGTSAASRFQGCSKLHLVYCNEPSYRTSAPTTTDFIMLVLSDFQANS